jgi:predicted Zn-ribbon and HTH transcriptional regulator
MHPLTLSERQRLLQKATKDFGFSGVDEMFESCIIDSVVPATCRVCGYTTEMEPDQDGGWCEVCEDTTVVSVLILGGLI